MSLPDLLQDGAQADLTWRRQVKNLLNNCVRFAMNKGETGGRPAAPTDGQQYYDRTLKKPVWWNADDGEWKDAAGTPA